MIQCRLVRSRGDNGIDALLLTVNIQINGRLRISLVNILSHYDFPSLRSGYDCAVI
jgi:hypothetical protein